MEVLGRKMFFWSNLVEFPRRRHPEALSPCPLRAADGALNPTQKIEKQGLLTVRRKFTLCIPFLETLRGGQEHVSEPLAKHFDLIMAVKIRMKRVGAKNAPVFRIVVADGRSPRDGKFIEEIGTYQPLKKGDNFKLDLDRAKYWLGKGAQPSETVASFIKKASKAATTTPAPAAAA